MSGQCKQIRMIHSSLLRLCRLHGRCCYFKVKESAFEYTNSLTLGANVFLINRNASLTNRVTLELPLLSDVALICLQRPGSRGLNQAGIKGVAAALPVLQGYRCPPAEVPCTPPNKKYTPQRSLQRGLVFSSGNNL